MSDNNKDLMNAEIFDEELSLIDGGSNPPNPDDLNKEFMLFADLRLNIELYRNIVIGSPANGKPETVYALFAMCLGLCDSRDLLMFKDAYLKLLENISNVFGSHLLNIVYVQNINKLLEGK